MFDAENDMRLTELCIISDRIDKYRMSNVIQCFFIINEDEEGD